MMDFESDNYFMQMALREARKAYKANEVPVGAVIVRDGSVIARAWNQVETLKDQDAVGDWRLEGCTLYVTKEPCPMCAGAIVHCRPDRVVFGCPDEKGGAAGGWINLLESNPPLNHRCDISAGVMQEECVALLQSFFREARDRKKAERDLIRKQAEEG
ncbi:MAG: tRNA-specific adenosine deaminase [Verrucomicrobiaceae bacterium]|nr:tRNA-specific adenosine deaminase [Verrucomicrobiaceae bacterium]